MNLVKKTLLLPVLAAICFTACEKKEQEPAIPEAELQSALGEAQVGALYDQLDINMVKALFIAQNWRQAQTYSSLPECAVVSRDEATRTITVDFGSGCTDALGRVHEGKLIINRTGRFSEPGSVSVVHPENYFVNEVRIEGTRTLTNISNAGSEDLQYRVSLQDGKFTWTDGSTLSREALYDLLWRRAADPQNDEWHLIGEASGLNRRGVQYTSTILSPLIYQVSCERAGAYVPVKGTRIITRPAHANISLDYGNGNCENLVTVSDGEGSRILDLKKN